METNDNESPQPTESLASQTSDAPAFSGAWPMDNMEIPEFTDEELEAELAKTGRERLERNAG